MYGLYGESVASLLGISNDVQEKFPNHYMTLQKQLEVILKSIST